MEKVWLIPAKQGKNDPAPGEPKVVLDPVTLRPLPAEGASKRLTPHWRRLIKDGSVSVGKPPRKPKATASAEESKD